MVSTGIRQLVKQEHRESTGLKESWQKLLEDQQNMDVKMRMQGNERREAARYQHKLQKDLRKLGKNKDVSAIDVSKVHKDSKRA